MENGIIDRYRKDASRKNRRTKTTAAMVSSRGAYREAQLRSSSLARRAVVSTRGVEGARADTTRDSVEPRTAACRVASDGCGLSRVCRNTGKKKDDGGDAQLVAESHK